MGEKIVKYATPTWGSPSSPTPNYKMRDISANYEQIYTKFSGIIPLTRRKRTIKKNLELFQPLWGQQQPPKYYKIPDIFRNYE